MLYGRSLPWLRRASNTLSQSRGSVRSICPCRTCEIVMHYLTPFSALRASLNQFQVQSALNDAANVLARRPVVGHGPFLITSDAAEPPVAVYNAQTPVGLDHQTKKLMGLLLVHIDKTQLAVCTECHHERTSFQCPKPGCTHRAKRRETIELTFSHLKSVLRLKTKWLRARHVAKGSGGSPSEPT